MTPFGWDDLEVLTMCSCMELGWSNCPACCGRGVVPERLANIARVVVHRWLLEHGDQLERPA